MEEKWKTIIDLYVDHIKSEIDKGKTETEIYKPFEEERADPLQYTLFYIAYSKIFGNVPEGVESWYSAKTKKKFSYCTWSDIDGNPVNITNLVKKPPFPDGVSRGRVYKYLG